MIMNTYLILISFFLSKYCVFSTSTPLVIENSWIAFVEGGDNCDQVVVAIDEWKKTTIRSSSNVEKPSETIPFSKVCFVEFDGVEELKNYVETLHGVKKIKPNLIVQESQMQPKSWGLDRIDQTSLPLSKTPMDITGTGNGVDVYVIDSGVFGEHEDFEGRARLGHDVVKELDENGKVDSRDGSGHGTHCAGTIAGKTYGVATKANIIGIKVFDKRGKGTPAGILKGLRWAIQHNKKRGGVISMSLSISDENYLNEALEEASENMIVVVAAGNQNDDACNYSPSSSQNVITVGATDKNDRRASFSNYGACVNIFAPGYSIISTSVESTTSEKTLSGTSMAAPHVSGVAAILLEKHGMNKQAAIDELYAIAAGFKIQEMVSQKSPNLLLQAPTYTGPPTPPTRSPTFRREISNETQLCFDADFCPPFALSEFGPSLEHGEVISGDLFDYNEISNNICDPPPSNVQLTNKIVLVEGNGCLFMDQLKNAEDAGAIFVVFHLWENLIPAYYFGDDTTNIPSVMISRESATIARNYNGKRTSFIDYNVSPSSAPTSAPSPSTTPRPTKPIPTSRPTKNPTPRPTTRAPTNRPTRAPTRNPSKSPTSDPTSAPTPLPTSGPTMSPTPRPTTRAPTQRPTKTPPTMRPTRYPTKRPTRKPTRQPTRRPTKVAT